MAQQETDSSAVNEALLQVYEAVSAGKLVSYAALKDFIRGLSPTLNKVNLLEHGFRLQRQLHWGFFRDLKLDVHPKIWRELVVVDRAYPQFGDLKRFAAIPNIYLALLDIHGYTQFCRDARHNISRVDLLDRMIQEDISKLCTKAGVINRRVRGDEILILGASPFDVLLAIDEVMKYFSQRKRITDPGQDKKDASHGFELPEFRLSAGIAGGQKYASLVITREGDLSGDIVNTAARLQARANKISPDRNRVLLTNQVYQSLSGASASTEKDLMKRFSFFNVGDVEFKGLSIGVYDLVMLPQEAWRMQYHPLMEALLLALKKGLWKKDVFEASLQLTSRLSIACPGFASQEKTRSQVTDLTKQVFNYWNNGFYESAIEGLNSIVDILKTVPQVDDVALEYLHMVGSHYQQLRHSFTQSLEKQIDANPPYHLKPEERKIFLTLQQHAGMYRSSRETLRLKHTERQEYWQRTCDEQGASLGTSLLAPK